MIGLRIREARKRVPYKQKELADIMGVTQKDISRWESGYCVPSTENIIKLAGILKTSTDELLKTDDDGVVRYDLYRNTLQTRNPMKIYEGCTVSESCDQYPDKIKSFTDKETALDELWRCYKSDVKEIRAFGGYIIYEVTEYYVEENTYDEDGEFKDGGDIVDFAPLPVKNDKDLHELAVMLLAYCGIIDDEMSEEEQWEAVKANEEHDFLSHIRGRDGYNYLWYADKNKNAAINIRTGEITDNADFIKNHLF